MSEIPKLPQGGRYRPSRKFFYIEHFSTVITDVLRHFVKHSQSNSLLTYFVEQWENRKLFWAVSGRRRTCAEQGELTSGDKTTHPTRFWRVDLPIYSEISVSVGVRLNEDYKGELPVLRPFWGENCPDKSDPKICCFAEIIKLFWVPKKGAHLYGTTSFGVQMTPLNNDASVYFFIIVFLTTRFGLPICKKYNQNYPFAMFEVLFIKTLIWSEQQWHKIRGYLEL